MDSRLSCLFLSVRDDREQVASALRSLGMIVDLTGGAAATIERFRKIHYDIVIVDHYLPDQSGLLFAFNLGKTQDRGPKSRFLLLCDDPESIPNRAHLAAMDLTPILRPFTEQTALAQFKTKRIL